MLSQRLRSLGILDVSLLFIDHTVIDDRHIRTVRLNNIRHMGRLQSIETKLSFLVS